MLVLLAESCHNDHECMVKGQDTRPTVQLLCLFLHVLIHLAVQRHDNIKLVLTCQAPHQASYWVRRLRTSGLSWITDVYAIANRNDQGTHTAMHEGCHNNSSINRQNHTAQNHDGRTHKWYAGWRKWPLDKESNWKYSNFTNGCRQLRRGSHTAWEQHVTI
jgi:hypothetical protein